MMLHVMKRGAQLAARIVDRVKGGESFAAIARSESHDPSSGGGGLLGTLPLGSLRPEVRGALEGLSPGQLSAPVRIPTGVAVFEVLAKLSGVTA